MNATAGGGGGGGDDHQEGEDLNKFRRNTLLFLLPAEVCLFIFFSKNCLQTTNLKPTL